MLTSYFLLRRIRMLRVCMLLLFLLCYVYACTLCVAQSAACAALRDCAACQSAAGTCGWCEGDLSDSSATAAQCMPVNALDASTPNVACPLSALWAANDDCPTVTTADLCERHSGDCTACLQAEVDAGNSTLSIVVSASANDSTSGALIASMNGSAIASTANNTRCGWCVSTSRCAAGDLSGPSSASVCNAAEWSWAACPAAAPSVLVGCARYASCAACVSAAAVRDGCGWCATLSLSGACVNGSATGAFAPFECPPSQWSYEDDGASCDSCGARYTCADCLSDARCAFCDAKDASGSVCIADANWRTFGGGGDGVWAYPFCSAVHTAQSGCALYASSAGSVNADIGASAAGEFATAALVLLSLAIGAAYALALTRRSLLPVAGQRSRAALPIALDVGALPPPPRPLQGPLILHASQRPCVQLMYFFTLLLSCALTLTALALNTYSLTSVSAATRAAQVGTVNPSNSTLAGSADSADDSADNIVAGVLGLSGVYGRGSGGGLSYDCTTFASSSGGGRVCATLAAAGACTLFCALAALLCSVAMLLLATLTAHRARQSSGVGDAIAAGRSLRLSPRLFTLALLHSVSAWGSVLLWALAGHLSLRAGIFVPHAGWTLGSSWALLLVCALLSLPTLNFCHAVVEFRPLSAGEIAVGDAAELQTNDTGGSDEGVDLSEDEQAEAYVVSTQLTQ